MRHFLLYHSEDVMGYRLGEERVNVWEGPAARDWNKSMADVSSWAAWADFREDVSISSLVDADLENLESDDIYCHSLSTSNGYEAQLCTAEASQVWMVEGRGRPRRYSLKGYFVPSNCKREPQTVNRRCFLYKVSGFHGEMYEEGLEVGQHEWFLTLKRVHQNFRTGFREIKDSGLIDALEGALDELRGRAPRT